MIGGRSDDPSTEARHIRAHPLDEVQPGGDIRQDISAGPALPNRRKDSEEIAMVNPVSAPPTVRGGTR